MISRDAPEDAQVRRRCLLRTDPSKKPPRGCFLLQGAESKDYIDIAALTPHDSDLACGLSGRAHRQPAAADVRKLGYRRRRIERQEHSRMQGPRVIDETGLPNGLYQGDRKNTIGGMPIFLCISGPKLGWGIP